jgi:ABC-type polysaccharide/polyol phosphate transport system ATPase subunit
MSVTPSSKLRKSNLQTTSEPKPVISVRNVSKRYLLYGRRVSLRQEAGQLFGRWLRSGSPRSENEYYWALRSVNLEVFAGERVAIVGRNGAGKTTLLRIISGITAPTEGSVAVHGRAVSLIGLGAGFDTIRTGRENIFLNAAIHGVMPK